MTYVEHLNKPTEGKPNTDAEIFNRLRNELQTKIVTNVYEEEDFKVQVYNVFEKMAKILSCTLGPYGGTTMIDQGTNYTTTKDGFHVLQNLRFADTKQNRIKSTLFSISHQMVTKVGDGSTSAVVAAFTFLKELMSINPDGTIRPKEMNEHIQKLVNEICNVIGANATSVTKENLLDVVHNITNIATNENKVYTDIICDIYKTLGPNCNINIEDSETMEDGVFYEDGIYTADYYLLDRIYHNKNNVNITKDCSFLMFDHTLDSDSWDMFIAAFNNFCYKTRRTLIIIAPFYEQYLTDKIRRDSEEYVQLYSNQAKIPFRLIFLKSNLTKPIQKDMYKDLSSLLGATIYQPVDTREWFNKFNEYRKACQEAMSNKTDAPEFPKDLLDDLEKHIGYCDEATMGDRISSFKGFTHKNEALFNTLYHDAETSLLNEEARVLKTDAIDNKMIDARTRFIKINCKSATIKVGGSNQLEMTINTDAVDDAVKACASAIKYGYNQGCNLAIVKAIDTIKNNGSFDENSIDMQILNALRRAFLEVYKTVLCNGMNAEKAEAIIEKSTETYNCYDMVSGQEDTSGKIINSCRTDIEILKGAIAMVAVVMSCNQYISTTLNN